MAASTRLPWIDHLRTFVIVLVVNMHACVTYSHVGDWYALSEREPTLAEKVPFILWQAHLQSFFMGLLFFVSGYFAEGSLARRGPAAFARERLIRLGLPTLFYMLVIHPFILLGLNPWNHDFGPTLPYLTSYITSGRFIGESGPLWFAFALLIFCLLFAAWRSIRGAAPSSASPQAAAPSGKRLLLAGLGLVLGTFATRLVQPIGTNILNMQLCFFVQYLVFFVAGIHAARRGWLLPLAAAPLARRVGMTALVLGPTSLLTLLLVGSRSGPLEMFFGGWHWQAFGYAFWEQLTGLALSLGLLALFSRKLNFETPLLRWLADRSFAVYVLHTPVLVALLIAFRGLPQNPYFLIVLMTLTGLVISFALAAIAKRIPGLRAIL